MDYLMLWGTNKQVAFSTNTCTPFEVEWCTTPTFKFPVSLAFKKKKDPLKSGFQLEAWKNSNSPVCQGLVHESPGPFLDGVVRFLLTYTFYHIVCTCWQLHSAFSRTMVKSAMGHQNCYWINETKSLALTSVLIIAYWGVLWFKSRCW